MNLNTQQRFDATIPWDTGAASIPSWVHFNLWTLILARQYGSPCRVCSPHTEQGVGIKTKQSCLQRKELTCVRGDPVAGVELHSTLQSCWEKLRQSQDPWLHQEQLWVYCSFWEVGLFLAWNISSLVSFVTYSWQTFWRFLCLFPLNL